MITTTDPEGCSLLMLAYFGLSLFLSFLIAMAKFTVTDEFEALPSE
jgi:hypothetical protein